MATLLCASDFQKICGCSTERKLKNHQVPYYVRHLKPANEEKRNSQPKNCRVPLRCLLDTLVKQGHEQEERLWQSCSRNYKVCYREATEATRTTVICRLSTISLSKHSYRSQEKCCILVSRTASTQYDSLWQFNFTNHARTSARIG